MTSASGITARRRLPLFVIVLGLLVLLLGAIFALAGQLTRARDELELLRMRAESCDTPAIRSEPLHAHDDRPASDTCSGEQSGYFAKGVDLAPLWTLRVQRVDGDRVTQVRLGSPHVVSPQAVHLIGLWAPWCASCKHLLPRLAALLERHVADWGDRVRFLPIQVKADTDPVFAYRDFGHLMPSSWAQLADMAPGDPLCSVLKKHTPCLYRGDLPVTFAVDCNRRVRWAKIGAVAEAELKELERVLEEIATELRDGDLRCRQGWCGDGRCEAGEEESGCSEDCNVPGDAPPEPSVEPQSQEPPVEPKPMRRTTPRVRVKTGDPAGAEPVPLLSVEPCPGGCQPCVEGRCVRLMSSGPSEAPPDHRPLDERPPDKRCGDDVCEGPRETTRNCCEDCGCPTTLTCRRDGGGYMTCLPPRLMLE